MGNAEAHDFVRWDVLDNLSDRLAELAEQTRALADDLAPGKLTMIDAPSNARIIRSYFDALDQIGWHSDEQMEAAS
ncbi:MAG: hypothetical protein EDQ89_00235 [Acidobacteria bacterium]|nr:MAG: hypothetical protein EDQ89_00235 [Acidobacteriota bacterium]